MGGEGANWIGEAPFSTREHVFQNIGDGTYNHSGLQAIRAAIYSGVNMTYKILYNDAVAMTGGQGNDGGLTPQQIVAEVSAFGATEVVVVHDEKEKVDAGSFGGKVEVFSRDKLLEVEERLSKVKGVSVLVYIQTCAAEKRRRRKRGKFPDPDKRVFINTDICEGCGDCGVQSNCVAIVPVETELGRKRAIDQSACNKDFSCLKGFCPSFVTIEGAKPKKAATKTVDVGTLPDPDLPAINDTFNMIVTGVGGTGVVTIGAVLAQAAQIDGKGAALMEMAGLAQKGGAVHIHCRIAEQPDDISAVRVATGEADALIGGDLVVSAGAKTLSLARTGRTGAVVNSHEIVTGEFTRDTEFRIPGEGLRLSLEAKLQDKVTFFDASELARVLMGDTIFSNVMMLGAAWQNGLVPLSHSALIRAIELNGAAVDRNKQAFEYGRWAAQNPGRAAALVGEQVAKLPETLDQIVEVRAKHLRAYQSPLLARRYRKRVNSITDDRLREAVAKGYHKLLAYKDEYEVSRLLQNTRKQAKAEFDGRLKFTYYMAPPSLSKRGRKGQAVEKKEYGPGMVRMLGLMSQLKMLRGTPFDPFGYTAERKVERKLIRQYEKDLNALPADLSGARLDAAVALAELPLKIRGFGHVKQANHDKAMKERTRLLAVLNERVEPRLHAAE